MGNLSRRDFLKGVAASAASVAGISVLGAAVPAAQAAPSPEAAAVPDKLWTAYINPQKDDAEWRTAEKSLDPLFTPISYGNVTASNRIVKSAAGSATYLNGPTDEFFQYYVNFAKGGVPMIYLESVAWLEIPADTGVYSPEILEYGQKLSAACAEYGASLGYQISGFGMGENDMSIDDIHAKQARMVQVALGLTQLGIKVIEFNCAGFNMPEHFLSRYHNKRTDEYGIGSLENRARFIVEVIEAIKAEMPDLPIQILIDAIEEDDNVANNPTMMTLDSVCTDPNMLVNTYEEGIEFAKMFEKAGATSMHLRLGPLGHHVAQFGSDLYFILNGIEGVTGFGAQYDFNKHWEGMLIGDTSGCGQLLNVAAEYKKALSIPVGCVTYMDPAHAPDFFVSAIEDGKIDFMLMNRPLTVDMEYVNKLKEGRADEIAPCTRCLHCHIAGNEANRMQGYCRVNALTQRVMTENGPASYELDKAETAKKVMVVGGGPAGMEAARIAALRGHDVTLYEKRGTLGFMLDFAEMVKGKHENLSDLKKYLIHQMELAGVKVVTGTEVTPELVASENPDAVICAVGGLRDTLMVEGNTPVIDMDSFMFTDMGDNVIVYGSNAQAFDAALWLTVHKKRVNIVTPSTLGELDMQQSQHAKRMMTTALYALGVRAYPEAKLVSAADGVATIISGTGVEMKIKCDAIVNGADMLTNTSLAEAIGDKACTIGDAANPYNIALAIRAGNDAGRAV